MPTELTLEMSIVRHGVHLRVFHQQKFEELRRNWGFSEIVQDKFTPPGLLLDPRLEDFPNEMVISFLTERRSKERSQLFPVSSYTSLSLIGIQFFCLNHINILVQHMQAI